MALPDVLSAIRQLILDGPIPQGERAERRSALAARFADLSDDELDDLAGMPPERIAVYTRLIFNGERSLLQWAFPMSLAAIRRIAVESGDTRPQRETEFELMRDMHAFQPWRTPSSRALGANFQAFVERACPTWGEAWPGLYDLVDYERCDQDIFYAMDVDAAPADVEAMAAQSVDAWMETRVLMPPYVVVRAFLYDVLAVAGRWRREQALPESWPVPARCYAAAGRHPQTLMTSWVRLSSAEFAAMARVAPSDVVTVNDLAMAYIAAVPERVRSDEAAVFNAFFAFLSRCFEAGVLLIPKKSSTVSDRLRLRHV